MNRQAAGESFVTVSHSITTLMNNSDFHHQRKKGKKRECVRVAGSGEFTVNFTAP
jgi:hypothetical protein